MSGRNLLEEARRYHALGMAILWCHARDKRPIGEGWTEGPRKTWKELKAEYRPEFNIGVRTGTPSFISGKYLACIDVDIKKPEFREIAENALFNLVGFTEFPEVSSGTRLGSRHLYCLTDRPFKMITIGKGPKDPGEKHHAWEIVIYSDNRQMILPPSIHPNGNPYIWVKPLGQDIPTMDFGDRIVSAGGSDPDMRSKQATEMPADFHFSPVRVELSWLPIAGDVREAIERGTGIQDRSGYLLKACQALLSSGLTENEVLSVLTDKTLFLGQCAFEHARTGDRGKAALWVYRYTLKKLAESRDAVKVFSGVPLPVKEKPRKETGADFYQVSPRGGLVPDYEGLLKAFYETHPYLSIADMKTVYTFNGTHFTDITPIEIKAFAEDRMNPKPNDKTRNEFWNKVLVNHVERRRFFLDTTEGKINFKNGILDLNNGIELAPHSPTIGFRGVLPYGYDPHAACPRFRKWLTEVMLGDQELISVLQEFMGYIVRGGEYKYHKALWVGGTGRNGKSTFLDVLKALIGIGNFSTLSIKSLIHDKFASSDLDGKIANFSEETSPEEIADSGPFKNLTGDGDISAQKKFGDIYSFRNRAKLVMSYNTIPNLKDLSVGMLSRPLIVPFRKEIAEDRQDHSLKQKLFEELPGIFNFALEGWFRLERQNQFTRSARSDAALAAVKSESCNVSQWIEHYLSFTDDFGDTKRVTELYSHYRNHERYPYSLVNFARRLQAHPVLKERYRRNKYMRYYLGLKYS